MVSNLEAVMVDLLIEVVDLELVVAGDGRDQWWSMMAVADDDCW